MHFFRSCSSSFRRHFAPGRLGLFLCLSLLGSPALAALQTVRIVDHITGAGLSAREVDAYEINADGTESWRAKRQTDGSGEVRFELAGLGEGRRYLVKTQPYGQRLSSSILTDPATVAEVRAGTLQVRVFDGATGLPKSGQTISLGKLNSDASRTWVMSATSDADGWVRINPPGVGVEPYVVEAVSPTDGMAKVSEPLMTAGPHVYAIGNHAVVVNLKDAVTSTALANQWVEVWETTTAGSVLRLKRLTGTSGTVAFDLDGVGNGRQYMVRSQPYLQPVSLPVSSTGPLNLLAGRLQVKVIDGRSGQPYSWKTVALLEVVSEAVVKSRGEFRTGEDGILRLDPDLTSGRSYKLRANSLMDGTAKDSAVMSGPGSQQFVVGSAGLTVRLVDHVTSSRLTERVVDVFEVLADGSETWRAKQTTDAQGDARFDLDGLGAGRRYLVKAQPYGQRIASPIQTETGWLTFRAGQLQVQIVDGASGQPHAAQAVSLMRVNSDNSRTWVMNATSDSSGWVRLNPPQFGVEPYVLEARSPTDGQPKLSERYLTSGPHRFLLGNPAVTVRVVDAVSRTALANQWVEVWELLSSGQRALRIKRWTDTNGAVAFDLDGIGAGRNYSVKVQPFDQPVEQSILATGVMDVPVGALQVEVKDGRNGQPYAWKSVALLESLADGTTKWVADFRTGAEGVLRLDPEGLGARTYVLRATSLMDGSTKLSSVFSSSGRHQFKVGGVGLTVRLLDHISKSRLTGHAVDVYEVLADGSEVWRAKQTTDNSGDVRFDLDGLGDGRRYLVRAQPYGQRITSELISAAGWLMFHAGKLQVQIVDGTTGQGRSGQAVSLMKRSSDGTLIWVMNATSANDGWVRVNPPALGTDTYVMQATSPTDGQTISSQSLLTSGPHRFVIGSPVVTAVLSDAITTKAISGQWVEVWESSSSSAAKSLRARRQTDSAGRVSFDLEAIGTGKFYSFRTQPYLQLIEQSISAAGEVPISAGKLQVQLLDGRNGQAYGWKSVTLLELLPTGSTRWIGEFRTAEDGILRLDPDGLAAKSFVLRAASPVDGSVKQSAVFASRGKYAFTVGNAGLTARLIDHISEQRISGQLIDVYEVLDDGSEVWRTKQTTDSQGDVRFDLDGLGQGRRFVLKSEPYGHRISSDVISTTGWYTFRAGTSPVVLSDAKNLSLITGVTVVALEKLPDGSLKWGKQGVTDANGMIRFDLNGLGSGREYVLKAINPFLDGKDHFSGVLSARGAYSFKIDRDEIEELDRTPPELVVIEPAGVTVTVSTGGLRFNGTVQDDEGVREVRLILTMPNGDVVEKVATRRAESKSWYVHSGNLLSDPGTIRAIVRAVDLSYNETDAEVELKLIKDVTAPVIEVSSHASGATIPAGGAVVSGIYKDDTIGGALKATLTGGGLANPWVSDVEVSQGSGRWSVVISPEEQFSGNVSLLLYAIDSAGNQSSKTVTLSVSDTYAQVWHLLQRASFGAHPDKYRNFSRSGAVTVLQSEIAAAGGADSGFASRTEQLPAGTQVATQFVQHAIYSDLQLREAMAWFWDNHFNTTYQTHSNSQFELSENEAFRTHALGNFRALLGVSAHSPAMLYTLDGRSNMKDRPNENYARELMELHTLGVDGGYTQSDVEEVARAFTGWTVVDGAFVFDASKHDTSAKTVLGNAIAAGGGETDGERVLDILTVHPSTARFICRKLVTYFVSDVPVESLISRCAQTFAAQIGAADQMAQVVTTILGSSEFLGTTYRNAKVKTPLEFVVGAVRQLGGEAAGDDISIEIQRQGMTPFMYASPAGYSDLGGKWISANMLQTRSRFADRLLSYSAASSQTQFNFAQAMADEGYETAEGVVGRMLERLLGPTFVRRHRQLALDVLTENGSYPYFHGATDNEQRIRRLGKALMNLPDYHLQ